MLLKIESSPLVSIVILTKNGEKTIQKCLKNLFDQCFLDFEVIIIDSGSNDNTLQIASNFPIRLKRIYPKDFHHAQTRNLGISFCRGKYVVFLTQDAYPLNSLWLEELLKPFENKQVGAAYSRQIPRGDANPVERAFLLQTYPKFVKKDLSSDLETENPDDFVVLSDVSSAYRRNLVKFNPLVEACEDQEMGLRLLKAGYGIVYVPTSLVSHSHNFSLVDLLKRYQMVGKASSVFSGKGFDPGKSIKYVVKLFSSTTKYVVTDKKTNVKMIWLGYSVLYNSLKIFGFLFGYLPNRYNHSKKASNVF